MSVLPSNLKLIVSIPPGWKDAFSFCLRTSQISSRRNVSSGRRKEDDDDATEPQGRDGQRSWADVDGLVKGNLGNVDGRTLQRTTFFCSPQRETLSLHLLQKKKLSGRRGHTAKSSSARTAPGRKLSAYFTSSPLQWGVPFLEPSPPPPTHTKSRTRRKGWRDPKHLAQLSKHKIQRRTEVDENDMVPDLKRVHS